MAKLDQLVHKVEGQVYSGEFNGGKECDEICGGYRVPNLPGEA